jgi:hypothetical protein
MGERYYTMADCFELLAEVSSLELLKILDEGGVVVRSHAVLDGQARPSGRAALPVGRSTRVRRPSLAVKRHTAVSSHRRP